MTETTRTLFEQYQVRKTKKQKDRFISFVQAIAQKNGYTCQVEKGACGARNIVVGNVSAAKVIFAAHYDTCPVLPFPNFITPKNFLIYLLYQLALVAGFVVVAFLLGVLVGIASVALGIGARAASFVSVLIYWGLLLLLIFGPANKHTANDNTSGVSTLLDIMSRRPKEQAAFVFFDLEEMGLFGSKSFAKKHKKIVKDKLLLNFDCVSDGENILFALKKGAIGYKGVIEKAFASNGNVRVEVLSKGVFYPSDQMNFPAGVGVAALKKSKHFGVLYMDRIHTNKDVIYRKENVKFLVDGSIKLTELI